MGEWAHREGDWLAKSVQGGDWPPEHLPTTSLPCQPALAPSTARSWSLLWAS